MKKRIALLVLLIPALVLTAQARINGFLSASFLKGLGEAATAQGSLQDAQLGLIFSGDIGTNLTYLAEIRFNQEATFELDQALVAFSPSNSFNLKLGLYLVPFGRYNMFNRPHQTILVRTPLNIEKMVPLRWKDVGVLVEGRTRTFFYSAFLGNGLAEAETLSQGQQWKDNNRDKGKGGRLGVVLGRAFEVAYSLYRGKYDEANTRNLVLQGVDLVWGSEGIQLFSEYTRASMDIPDETANAEGFYVMASFDMDKLRPVASFQKINYEDGFHGPGFLSPDVPGEGITEKQTRWTVGFVYSLSESFLLKFEYDFNREKDEEVKNDSFSIQVAVSF